MNEMKGPAVLLLLAAAMLLGERAPLLAMSPPEGPPPAAADTFPIPASLRAEHDEIHQALESVTQEPGAVGEAARNLAAVLGPHFQREQEIALPPLGLLRPLVDGPVTPAMSATASMAAQLEAELPGMLAEHEAIGAALDELSAAATAVGHVEAAELAGRIRQHARSEEEVTYPAAVLVGRYVRSRIEP